MRSFSDVDHLCTFDVDLSSKDLVSPDVYVKKELYLNLYGVDLREEASAKKTHQAITLMLTIQTLLNVSSTATLKKILHTSQFDQMKAIRLLHLSKKDSDRYENYNHIKNEEFNRFNSTIDLILLIK